MYQQEKKEGIIRYGLCNRPLGAHEYFFSIPGKRISLGKCIVEICMSKWCWKAYKNMLVGFSFEVSTKKF